MLKGITDRAGMSAGVGTISNASGSPAGSKIKMLHGNHDRGEELMNMMNRLKQLPNEAAQTVRAGNPTLG